LEINGRHFVETGLAAGFSLELVARIFEDILVSLEGASITAQAKT